MQGVADSHCQRHFCCRHHQCRSARWHRRTSFIKERKHSPAPSARARQNVNLGTMMFQNQNIVLLHMLLIRAGILAGGGGSIFEWDLESAQSLESAIACSFVRKAAGQAQPPLQSA